jgi:hypothetical protein
MRPLNFTIVLLSLLSLLGAVGAWPDFHNHRELIVGTLSLMGCATFVGFNLLRSSREYEQEIPAIGSDEEVFEDSWMKPTTTADSTPTAAQTDLLPSLTQDAPRTFYTIFEFDPPETVPLFSGSPPVPKVIVAEVDDNGTLVGTEVIVRLADVEENFQDFTFPASTKTASSVTDPTTYPDVTLGVNIPTPDSTHLNTTSSKWALPTLFIHALQDSRLKPFVESARRKLNFFWGLRNTLFGPLIRFLPVRPQTLGFVLMGVKLLNVWRPGMTRRRRQLSVRYAPRFATILQRLGWFATQERTPQLAIEDVSGVGPQVESSPVGPIDEVKAIVRTLESLASVIERQLVNIGRQEENQADDREYVDAVEKQVPVGGTTLKRASEPSPQPPKLPAFTNTRSTIPIADYTYRRRLPIIAYQELRKKRSLVSSTNQGENKDVLPHQADPKKSLRGIYRAASAGPSAPAPVPAKSSRAVDDTVLVPVSASVGVTPSSADQELAAQPDSKAAKSSTVSDPLPQSKEVEIEKAKARSSTSSDPAPQLDEAEIKKTKGKSTTGSEPQPQLDEAEIKERKGKSTTGSEPQPQLDEAEIKERKGKSTTGSEPQPQSEDDSRRYSLESLAHRLQEECGVKGADPAQLHRFLDFFGLWDAVNDIPAKILHGQWLGFQTAEEKRQATATAYRAVSIEAESSSAVKNVGTSTDSEQLADATAVSQSSNVAPPPAKINSAQRLLLKEQVRRRLKKDFGVNDADSKNVEQFLDIYGWHKLSQESLNEVCVAWLVWEAEEKAKTTAAPSDLQPHPPAVASEGEQTAISIEKPASTEVSSKSASSETVDDEEDGTNADGKRKLGKPKEDLPPMSHVEDDSDDDSDDGQDEPPHPPPSSGAVVAGTSSAETKPVEERNNTAPASGGGNGSGNNEASTQSAAPAPVIAASQRPVFNGFQFNVQSRLPERPVYQVSGEDRIFNIIPDVVGASTHRRSALRNREHDADEAQPRLKPRGRARIAENFDGSPIAETRHFGVQEPPARIQRVAEMDIDAEGQEATGAPVPVAAQPASVQSFPAIPEFSAEVEGIGNRDFHKEMEGVELGAICPAHPEDQQQQSTMSHQQPEQDGTSYNMVAPFGEPLVQDQEETMLEEQRPSNAALFDDIPPSQVTGHQTQLSQYDPHSWPTLDTTEWNNPGAIDEQDRQRQQQPQQQPMVLQGQDWADPDDFFNSIGLSPNATEPRLNVELVGEMPEIQALLDSLHPTDRTEYDPNDPHAGMQGVEMDSPAEGAHGPQDAPEAAPTPVHPAAGDLSYGNPSEYAVAQPQARDFVDELSGMTPEAPESTSQPAMSPLDRAKLQAALESLRSASFQNNADRVQGSPHSYGEPIIDDRTDEEREWGVPPENSSKQYEGHVRRRLLMPKSRLMGHQATTPQPNPFSNLLRPQSNIPINPEDIQIPEALAAALQLRHSQAQQAGISQLAQQPTRPHESHAGGELNPAPGRGSEGPQPPATHGSHQEDISFEDSAENYLHDSPEEEAMKREAEEYSRT